MHSHIVIQAIDQFRAYLKKLIERSLVNKIIVPYVEEYFYWKFDHFTYSQNGVTSGLGRGVFEKRDNWLQAYNQINQVVLDSLEFEDFDKVLLEYYPWFGETSKVASQICNQLISIYLNVKSENQEKEIANITAKILRDLNYDNIVCKIKVELVGITLEPDKITISSTCILRQVRSGDIERPRDVNSRVIGLYTDSLNFPTAVLEIELEIDRRKFKPEEFQDLINKYVAILRLYNCGAIDVLQYSITTDAIINIPFGGEVSNNLTKISNLKYCITTQESTKFVSFVSVLSGAISDSIYLKVKDINFLGIAFERYCDAIVTIDVLDKRVSSIAMGLEAILSDTNNDISYKLWQRCSKLSCYLGKNPLEVRKLIKTAYAFRSSYAHGQLLKDKDRLAKLRGHETEDVFVTSVIDVLRRILVLYIVCKINKNEAIELLDCAMIDNSKNADLGKLVEPYIDLF